MLDTLAVFALMSFLITLRIKGKDDFSKKQIAKVIFYLFLIDLAMFYGPNGIASKAANIDPDAFSIAFQIIIIFMLPVFGYLVLRTKRSKIYPSWLKSDKNQGNNN